ncbi:unnamed protein product [Rotaria sp. Silwood2]|nr:unnamed protein product [Rotaria sp. Silwood2]CAF3066865.1 unnamed protein product [Rotaria sp. Silwood2]CAF3128479.1 unnamed protein product [Rotaria sp. Silwood2]CAF3433415.1 unnamed protein product [Rotaria sp. Silwood2]CAF4645158.1 unnamed protein product [Rotaria sp. Silwood2]
MLFQLAHANENGDGVGYTIKHVFVKASSLHHAHLFVTLFGYRISPEYYDDDEDSYESSEEQIQNTLQKYSLEVLERINDECSQGEHYWHAIKPIEHNGMPLELGGTKIFKVIIQFKLPCIQHYDKDPQAYSLYKVELNIDIYQFKANDSTNGLEYIRQNSDTFNLTDFFRELPNELNWQIIKEISEKKMECTSSSHLHGEFICMKCEELQSPIPIFDSNM